MKLYPLCNEGVEQWWNASGEPHRTPAILVLVKHERHVAKIVKKVRSYEHFY